MVAFWQFEMLLESESPCIWEQWCLFLCGIAVVLLGQTDDGFLLSGCR